MKKEEKKLILIIIAIGIVIIGGLLLWRNLANREAKPVAGNENVDANVEEYVEVLSDGSKLNTSEELAKTKQLDGLEIKNIQFREIGGITTLLANVENKTGKETERRWVRVEVLDKEGNVITSIRGIIDTIPAGGTVQLNMGVTADVANAYDFRISNM